MSDNSRLTKNTILLYIRMLVVMAISLYTSRIVLKNLGISDYGLYNVVGSIAAMFTFLNNLQGQFCYSCPHRYSDYTCV